MSRQNWLRWFFWASLLVCPGLWMGAGTRSLAAQETQQSSPTADAASYADGTSQSKGVTALERVTTKTLGGQQFWTDHLVWPGWRIQRNVLTGHYRLLDKDNRRHASGTFEHCQRALEQRARHAPQTKRTRDDVVLLLHGIADTRNTMQALAAALAKTDRYTVLNVSYASTRQGIAEHAQALRDVLSNLPDAKRLHLVGYSMGNLVIRNYWHQAGQPAGLDASPVVSPAAEQTLATSPPGPDRRIRRIVMLAPPNQGAQLAIRLGKHNKLFEWVLGDSGQQLGVQWDAIERQLAIPTCEFGIIAGSGPEWSPGNPLVEGTDDNIVRVSETRLAGAADFMVLPVTHKGCPEDPTVIQCTLRFLDHGYFVAADRRHPIPRN